MQNSSHAVTDTFGRLSTAILSDVGLIRQHNEDSIACDMKTGLLILADGMGGCNGGEVASSLAVGLIINKLKEATELPAEELSEHLWRAVAGANLAIYQTAERFNQYEGMGTTLIAAHFYENHVCIAHIGDSRLYRLRDRQLVQMTVDHTVLQEQVDQGLMTAEQARVSFGRGLITRALGVDPEVDIDIIEDEVLPQDTYLLCSDGLFDMVEDTEICDILNISRDRLDQAAQALVDRANQHGGYDNISVVLARVSGD